MAKNTASVRERLDLVRETLHEQIRDLGPLDARDLLSDLACDITGHIEALDEEIDDD